jgi:hypothetical protein
VGTGDRPFRQADRRGRKAERQPEPPGDWRTAEQRDLHLIGVAGRIVGNRRDARAHAPWYCSRPELFLIDVLTNLRIGRVNSSIRRFEKSC